ncbi:transcriptional regulator [Paramagnetospirillum kuznetsovii]|uniref:Transcriptional regulator n=1 Tax=Paramagnetospirillum kuznetsovii TaxID=2053833 RepID=A0A364P3C7_9PROT|nr:type II toxin-antitoxin system VapB family antitoxin [Paramagnetospirillum kuznetsovii]RAU23615.1 transcriptional regulator [Paramagnetospirillum kuznetsovii]
MSIQIANPQVVAKINRLARATSLGKTAVVEAAVDRMLAELADRAEPAPWGGIEAIVAQMHQLAPRHDAFDAVEYDHMGLPK